MPDNLPPGTRGLPLLGETLSALKNMFAFLENKRAKHGSVFRSHILGNNVVVLSGPDGAAAFLDQDKVSREQAHPSHVRDLFGGINMNMFDGPRHARLKSLALEAFDRTALASYLPPMQALVDSTLARLAAGPEFRAVTELRQLAIDAIAKNVLDLEPGEETRTLCNDYVAIASGMLSAPIPLPGTTYSRARKSRDRTLAFFRKLIAERRAEPRDDGLSRMLQARDAEGVGCTDDEALLELHHILIAGYIVFGLFIELLQRLHAQPELRARAEAEIRAHAAKGPFTFQQLMELDLNARLVREAKRTAPILPLVFGKARRSFDVNGFVVPEGWSVWWGLTMSNMDPTLWKKPEEFDPDRYAPPRAEDQVREHTWTPQGSGPLTGHKCLGFDYSTLLTQVFLVALLRGYTWEIAEQSREYHWDRTPAEPREGLRMTLRRA